MYNKYNYYYGDVNNEMRNGSGSERSMSRYKGQGFGGMIIIRGGIRETGRNQVVVIGRGSVHR